MDFDRGAFAGGVCRELFEAVMEVDTMDVLPGLGIVRGSREL